MEETLANSNGIYIYIYIYIRGRIEEAVVMVVMVGYLIMIPGQRLLLGKAREETKWLAATRQQTGRRPLRRR